MKSISFIIIKNLLLFTLLILVVSCSSNKIDKSKIVGSWYFVSYTDKSFSKSELYDFEEEFGNRPESWISNFNYTFKADNTYEYKIYGVLTNKGIYSINHNNLIILLDKMKSKKDTMKVEFLDDKFLQVNKSNNGTERLSIYFKTNYKFPEIEVNK
ncbi:DUF5004 domain-containing protein [Flavobacterium sp. LHD-80]|uniref:DUF5004 domain-containing protein n=1 Tax=Flavobacterium sp. LHD-80 TaxID=3071411 RepID=UPI0027E01377|nr:DUF5004 domain-containing protein [Flavobacterium sp. LHD-80]MDQ6472775.1 DUF5004 domain-containing protein [Flavobacterium sp. LHD-80]